MFGAQEDDARVAFRIGVFAFEQLVEHFGLVPKHDVHHRLFLAVDAANLLKHRFQQLAHVFSAFGGDGYGRKRSFHGIYFIVSFPIFGNRRAVVVFTKDARHAFLFTGCLEVAVVGCGSSAGRTVVQDEILVQTFGKVEHVFKTVGNRLRAMVLFDDGKMPLEYGVGVEAYMVIFEVDSFLLRRAVLFAEEAGSLRDGCGVGLRQSGARACRVGIVFHLHHEIVFYHLQLLHLLPVVFQQFEVRFSQFPSVLLPLDHFVHVRLKLGRYSVFFHPCLKFPSTYAVFIQIVAVHLLGLERRVGVPFPSAATVKHIIDASDAVLARDSQPYRIIFSIAGVGQFDLPQQRREESSRSSQPVDAQRVVPSVLRRPLLMVDDARRYFVHIEICHLISAYHHAAVFPIESIDYFLERMFVGVYIVAVELYGKLAALLMSHAQVPATAYAQVVSFGNQVDEAFVFCQFCQRFGGSVCGVIVDNDDVVAEPRLLLKSRTYGIADGTNPVAHRNNDRRFVFEFRAVQVDVEAVRI